MQAFVRAKAEHNTTAPHRKNHKTLKVQFKEPPLRAWMPTLTTPTHKALTAAVNHTITN